MALPFSHPPSSHRRRSSRSSSLNPVPALIVWILLGSLVLQAFAIGPDRPRLLRGLLVTFGAAFTLKFVVLAAISAPAQGRWSRALQLLFEGLTIGSISQRPARPWGYVAFGTLALYLVGIALLPAATWQMVRSPTLRSRRW